MDITLIHNPEKSGFRIRKIQKSGFFESCRARYELSIRTYDAEMNFGGKKFGPALPEENWRTDFETEEVYTLRFKGNLNSLYQWLTTILFLFS